MSKTHSPASVRRARQAAIYLFYEQFPSVPRAEAARLFGCVISTITMSLTRVRKYLSGGGWDRTVLEKVAACYVYNGPPRQRPGWYPEGEPLPGEIVWTEQVKKGLARILGAGDVIKRQDVYVYTTVRAGCRLEVWGTPQRGYHYIIYNRQDETVDYYQGTQQSLQGLGYPRVQDAQKMCLAAFCHAVAEYRI